MDHTIIHHVPLEIAKDDPDAMIDPKKETIISRLTKHLTDIPFLVWIAIISLFYLAGFLLLLACTKQNPKQFLTTPIYVLINSKLKENDKRSRKSSREYMEL